MALPERRSILVVDDELSVREILAEGLELLGYCATSAGDAPAALAAIHEHRPALVLSDIEMAGGSGLELLERIKSGDPDLDVIMVTGVVDVQTAVEAIRRGAADYVTKPFNLDEVQIVIERTLEKRRLIEQNRAYQEQLEQLVAQRTHELEVSHEATLQALVTALDYRDNETQGHSYRVVEYAVLVARRMGLDESTLGWIRRGAILHDVGKIGVPDAVLRKPGPLDAPEWVQMQRHPEMGYRMLEHIGFLGPALDIVLCHQERFDGSGYPRCMRSTEIPLGARIFAVVDTFDAMTSDRPYRAALSVEVAREEIRRCSGKQFDPQVVGAFLGIDAGVWHTIRDRVHREVLALGDQVRSVLR